MHTCDGGMHAFKQTNVVVSDPNISITHLAPGTTRVPTQKEAEPGLIFTAL